MTHRHNHGGKRQTPQSATLRSLTLSLPLPRASFVDRCLPPRLALSVLNGTHGVKSLFFPLAEAATVAGALCAMGLEQDSLDVVRTGQQTVGLAFMRARETEIWAINHEEFPALARTLEVYERQLAEASQSQILAAESFVKELQQERQRAGKTLKRAA